MLGNQNISRVFRATAAPKGRIGNGASDRAAHRSLLKTQDFTTITVASDTDVIIRCVEVTIYNYNTL